MPSVSASHNQLTFSVSELSGALKKTVEDAFGQVRVRGELSGLKRAASGHCYLDLKDEKAVLNAVCWRGVAEKLSFALENGLEVIATGKLTTYPGRSNYQLVIDHLEPAGVGALMALLEKRRTLLAAEGLFDQAIKKPLPFLPQTIGVVTSPTGAVIRDILHRLTERFPVHVLIWPVRVQGEGAAAEIAAAIEGFNALPEGGAIPRPELLIVARGGGSIEDLWAFNEEIVVRAVHASRIPLIAAVGHETDTTLIDHAADKRAPTPTAAAEIAVPVLADWLLSLEETGFRLRRTLLGLLDLRARHIEGLARGLPRLEAVLAQFTQRFDDVSEQLVRAPMRLIDAKRWQFEAMTSRFHPVHFNALEEFGRAQLQKLHLRLNAALEQTLRMQEQRLGLKAALLGALDYRNVLQRGYALVTTENGVPVTSRQAMPETPVDLQFADGSVRVVREAPARAAKKKAPPLPGAQGQLW